MDDRSIGLADTKEADPEEAHRHGSDSGVDDSLIRWMLSLTLAERLQALQGFVDSIETLRHGSRT